MKDEKKTKTQLIAELADMRQDLKRQEAKLKRSEKAMRREQEQWQRLFRSIQVAVVVHDADTKIIKCNRVAQELLGLSEEQMLGKEISDPVWKFLREDGSDLPLEEYPVKQVLDKKKPLKDFSGGVRSLEKSEPTWVLLNAVPIHDHNGKIVQVVISFMDTSGRRQAEEALREDANVHEEAQKMGKIGHWKYDMKSQKIVLSGQALALVELDPEKGLLSVDEYPSFFNREDKERILKLVAQAIKSGESFEMDYKVKLPSGKSAHHNSTFHPIKDENGEISALMGTVQDISELKRFEEVLRENEEKYRNLFNQSNDGILLHDLEGNIIDVNQRVLEQFEYTRSEIMALKIFDLHPPGAHDTSQQAFKQISEEGFVRLEIDFKKKNGRIFPAEVSSSLFEIGGKKVIQGIIRDITKRRISEVKLRESEYRFRSLFQNAPIGIGLADSRGLILEGNDAIIRMFGLSKEELDKVKTNDLYYSSEERRILLEKFKKKGSVHNHATKFKYKDGGPFDASITIIPLTQYGEDVHLTVVEDITEQKQVEREREVLITELQDAMSKVKTLSGMLPICSSCKNIRDDKGYWKKIEAYLRDHSNAKFSHSICPECMDKLYGDQKWYKKK